MLVACLWRACGVCGVCVCACVCCGFGCVCVSVSMSVSLVWCDVIALSSLWCCLSVVVWWIVVDALSAAP